jgi:hypothetical protein
MRRQILASGQPFRMVEPAIAVAVEPLNERDVLFGALHGRAPATAGRWRWRR